MNDQISLSDKSTLYRHISDLFQQYVVQIATLDNITAPTYSLRIPFPHKATRFMFFPPDQIAVKSVAIEKDGEDKHQIVYLTLIIPDYRAYMQHYKLQSKPDAQPVPQL